MSDPLNRRLELLERICRQLIDLCDTAPADGTPGDQTKSWYQRLGYLRGQYEDTKGDGQ